MWSLLAVVLIVLGVGSGVQAQDTDVHSPESTAVLSLSWSPDGGQLAVTTRDRLRIYNHNWVVVQELMLNSDEYPSVYWSPDGTRLILGRQILDALTLRLLVEIDSPVNLGGWGNDSSRVFAVAADGTGVTIFDATSGNEVTTISIGKGMINSLIWSPDNTAFAGVFSAEDSFFLIDVANSTIRAEFPQSAAPGPLSWSPDSSRIAGTTERLVEAGTPGSVPSANSALLFEVYVWDADTGEILNRFSGLPEYPRLLRWHPNGIELAGSAFNGSVFVWNTATNEQTDYFLSLGAINAMEYSSSGGRLVVGSDPSGLRYVFPERRMQSAEQVYVDNPTSLALELFVPAPSIERLNAIAAACDAPVSSTTHMADFIAQIEALPADSIPPACAADLLAVARALEGGS